jgi:transposase
VGLPLLLQPPYAPELNPAERVFDHLRAGIEGVVYEAIKDKVAAVETILEELDADPERIKRLTGWHWIVDALHQLPRNRAA